MTKQQYIEQFGYISNKDYRRALEKVRDYNINIQDWQLPEYKMLSQKNIDLMIELRLHIKYNSHWNFTNNFFRMGVLPKGRGIYAVNYTGHTLCYNGIKFFGDYSFCINKKKLKPIDITNEQLCYIDGVYPVYSITSLLEEDIRKVISTNPSWWQAEVTPILITKY